MYLPEYFGNVSMLLAGAAILGSPRPAICRRTGEIISYFLVFCSFDVILQSILGVNILGLEPPINGRYWGMFVFGAPSFGVFASILFFGACFYLRGKYLMLGSIIVAVLLSGDRGAILSLLWSMTMYVLFIRKNLSEILLAGVFFGAVIVILANFSWLIPARILSLVDFLFEFWEPSFDVGNIFGLAEAPESASIAGYIQKYQLIWTGWFSWDNGLNAFFGTGWGLTHEKLAEVTGVGRPHNLLLELVIIYGIFTPLLFLKFILLLSKHKKFSTLIIVYTSPFMFYSVYSFNFFIIFILMYSMMMERSKTVELALISR
jgi:hypothetical protein